MKAMSNGVNDNEREKQIMEKSNNEDLNNYSQTNPDKLELHQTNQIPLKLKIEIEIQEMKELYRLKLIEVDALNKEIIKIDEDLSNNNKNENNHLIIPHIDKGIHTEKKRLKKESEKESDAILRNELNKLQDEYLKDVELLLNEHEVKVDLIKKDIAQSKNELESYYDRNKYINKEAHERILFELMQNQQKELDPFEKEIAELEQYLSDTYPRIGNKELTNHSNYFDDNNIQDDSRCNVFNGIDEQLNKIINSTENNMSTINNNYTSENNSRFNDNFTYINENEKMDKMEGIKQINSFLNKNDLHE